MATEKVNIEYSVNDKGASKKVGLLSGAMKKLKDNAKLVAIAGIGALTAVIVKGLKAFGVQEKAIATLNQSLKNTGHFSKAASEDLQAYASSLQKVTTFGDEQILQGQALIASFGFQGEELKSLTAATADLAAAKGMDFVQAADLVAKAVGSETNALSRYGVQIDGAAGSTERATNAVKSMTAIFGGQAQAQAQTLSGSISQLQNAWGDLAEEIGAVFAPVVQQVAKFLKGLAEKFSGLNAPTKKIIIMVGLFGGALLVLLPLIATLVPAFIAGWIAITGPIGLAVIAVGLFVATFVKFKKLQPILATLAIAFGVFWAVATGGLVPLITGIVSLISWLLKLTGVFDSLDKKLSKTNKKIEETKEKLAEASDSGDNKEVAKLEEKLAKLEAVKKKYADKEKEKKAVEKEEAEEDAKTALLLKKDAERNQALLDQQATQREEKKAFDEELRAIDDEEELARFEAKLEQNAERGELTTQQELAINAKRSELKKANWQKEFSTWLGIEKLTLVQKQSTAQQMANWESFMANATNSKNKEVAGVAKALAKKDIIMKTSQAAMSAYQAMAAIPFVGPVLGAAAAAAALAFGAEQYNAVDTPLAEGGSMIVDQPTRIGTNVLAGEAGPERIDVTPLGGGGGEQTINNYIQIDGETIAMNVLKVGQQMRSEGTLDDGL